MDVPALVSVPEPGTVALLLAGMTGGGAGTCADYYINLAEIML